MAPVYSHSRLACFENCPKRFHYRYILKLPAETESIEAFMGKLVHAILERLHQFVQKGRIPSLPAVLKRYHEDWDQRFDPERVRVVRAGDEPSFYRESGERCLSNHYRRYYPFDREETLAIEKNVTFSLDPKGRVRMRGIIDRLVRAPDGAIEILDYKTSRRVPAQSTLDRDRQLALYQIALHQNALYKNGSDGRYAQGPGIRLVWHYLLFDQVRVSTRSEEQLDGLRHETLALVTRIEAEQAFEPKPSALCSWCEYNRLCPASSVRPRGAKAPAPDGRAASEAGPETDAPAPRSQLPLL